MTVATGTAPAPPTVAAKGLRPGAITFASSVVIGVASAAPGYSLASALGTIAGIAAFGTPGILIAAFVPMVCVALAYYWLNRAEPDCGTTFTWVTRTMGPQTGWMGGWAVLATNIIVMPSLAVIAGQYSLQLFGVTDPPAVWVTLIGIGWIVVMTAVCYKGIEVSARVQRVLLGAELAILLLFAVMALAKVYGGHAPHTASRVALAWFNPSATGSFDAFTKALLVAIFLYWGWDSGVTVNEETEDPHIAPGHAALVSTVLLVAVYVLVAAAALAYAGPELLAANSADVFAPIGRAVMGPHLDKLLILAVLTSASASTQTTILPAARTALSMARATALPQRFGEMHAHNATPSYATILMGIVSTVWFVGLSFLSRNVLDDSVLALGICIAFYYALTGFACVLHHRADLQNGVPEFVMMGLLPGLGGVMMAALFVKSCIDLAGSGATRIFGLGAPLVIGIGALLTGAVLMLLVRALMPEFFQASPQRPRVISP